MDHQKLLTLSETAWSEISRHAEDTFPEECCGVVFSNDKIDQVCRLKNIQNKLHAVDPQTHPRNATIAYNMDQNELQSAILEANKIGFKLKAFYHSHPNHDPYFSMEDRQGATPFGEPTYPEAAQIVVSIYGRTVKQICAFAWSDTRKDFVEISMTKAPTR
ncbi:MAG TPA: Mov34/MPN/PAD-1 family protein [Candidatus Udaeobacter sp.]|nr:Mov34/MPN/PAD-1 family protein [Candidatus Udaeobacter sp.]